MAGHSCAFSTEVSVIGCGDIAVRAITIGPSRRFKVSSGQFALEMQQGDWLGQRLGCKFLWLGCYGSVHG